MIMHVLYVMLKDKCIATIEYDYSSKKVYVDNYISDPIFLPFGIKKNPTIKDLEDYLESRCFPRERANRKELLQELGLQCYDPIAIIRKTHGVMYGDKVWLRVGEEDRTVYTSEWYNN